MYVITGATGNTGKHVARHLLAQGARVRVLGRSAERLQSLVQQGAEAVVTDVADAAALTRAFTGARAVYAMIPPDLASPDYPAYQQRVVEATAAALEQAGVPHAVLLSSIGVDKTDKTGPVLGLRRFEERLNRIRGLNALYLRAGYFMENTLPQAGIIRSFGMSAGPLRPDLKVGMIATRDIGAFAAEALRKLDFKGKQSAELLGQRDLTMAEVASILGKAVDKPNLQYIQLPDSQLRLALSQMGMSSNVAGILLEMAASLNSGHMRALEARSAANTTPTTYEQFVEEEFLPVYRGRSAAA